MTTTHHHLTRHSIAMRLHLQHDNTRLREALQHIVELSEFSTSALTLQDVARVARNALIGAQPANPTLNPTGVQP